MKLLVIGGSTRESSRSRGLSQWVVKNLKQHELTVSYFDLGYYDLPIYRGGEEAEHPNVQKLKKLAMEADGFFITTPEYHNGMSGALKNALDFLGGSHFKGKPTLIAATAGGGKGGINALNNLRLVLRGLYGLVLPGQFVADPRCFNDDFEFVENEAQERMVSLLEELVDLTKALEFRKSASK